MCIIIEIESEKVKKKKKKCIANMFEACQQKIYIIFTCILFIFTELTDWNCLNNSWLYSLMFMYVYYAFILTI
jgi:hypothetical protein